MTSVYNFSEIQMVAFFLVFLRMASFVVSWPIFGVSLVPSSAKILFAFLLAAIVFPTISYDKIQADFSSPQLIILCLREVLIGLALGYLTRLFFFAVSIAGEIIAVSIGMASGELFNPAMQQPTSAIEQFQLTLATLFLLGINGHHMFLRGLNRSFELIPISANFFHAQAFLSVTDYMQAIMVLGIKLSAPLMIAVLFMNMSMAVVGRAVPQINVLITSLPVNVLVGLAVLSISLPLMMVHMGELVEMTMEHLFGFMKAL